MLKDMLKGICETMMYACKVIILIIMGDEPEEVDFITVRYGIIMIITTIILIYVLTHPSAFMVTY